MRKQTWNPNEADPSAKKRLGTYSGNVIDRSFVCCFGADNHFQQYFSHIN